MRTTRPFIQRPICHRVALGLSAVALVVAACSEEGDGTTGSASTSVDDVTPTVTAKTESGFHEEWVPYETDGQFVVELPGEPELDTREVATASGPAVLDVYQVVADDAGVSVSVTPVPGVAGNVDAIDTMLAGAVAGAGESLDGTVVSDETVDESTYPARDAEIRVEAGGQPLVVFTRVLYAGDRLFQLQSLGFDENREVVLANFTRLVETFVPADI